MFTGPLLSSFLYDEDDGHGGGRSHETSRPTSVPEQWDRGRSRGRDGEVDLGTRSTIGPGVGKGEAFAQARLSTGVGYFLSHKGRESGVYKIYVSFSITHKSHRDDVRKSSSMVPAGPVV